VIGAFLYCTKHYNLPATNFTLAVKQVFVGEILRLVLTAWKQWLPLYWEM